MWKFQKRKQTVWFQGKVKVEISIVFDRNSFLFHLIDEDVSEVYFLLFRPLNSVWSAL